MVNSLMVKERFLLAKERIWGIESESILQPKYRAYFVNVAQFLKMLCENWSFVEEGKIRFLIGQDGYRQGYEPVMILFEKIFDGKEPEKEFAYTEIVIKTKYNLV